MFTLVILLSDDDAEKEFKKHVGNEDIEIRKDQYQTWRKRKRLGQM